MVYIAASLIGALVGGLLAFTVASINSRRERRARYGETMLATIDSAREKVERALRELGEHKAGDRSLDGPLTLTEEASRIWAQSKLASTLSWSPKGRRAMRSWAALFHILLSSGGQDRVQLEKLRDQLTAGEHLMMAWTAGLADASDFARPQTEVEEHFGPEFQGGALPDYGQDR